LLKSGYFILNKLKTKKLSPLSISKKEAVVIKKRLKYKRPKTRKQKRKVAKK